MIYSIFRDAFKIYGDSAKILVTAVCIFVSGSLPGRGQGVLWTDDSNSQFAVTITGIGQPSGVIDSPSGYWELDYGFSLNERGSRNSIAQGECMAVSFLRPPSALIFPGYSDVLPGPLPCDDGTISDRNISLGSEGWMGVMDITITSRPGLRDTPDWAWTITCNGSGPALPIPEPRTDALFLIVGAMVLFRHVRIMRKGLLAIRTR